MTIQSTQLELFSDGNFNLINITEQVAQFVQASGVRSGLVTVLLQHTTGAVFIGEHEAGITLDIEEMFERIIPRDYAFKHHIRQVDFNGHAHVRAALMQPNVSVPVVEGKMCLGTYQDIMVIDEQVDCEPRYLMLHVMGE